MIPLTNYDFQTYVVGTWNALETKMQNWLGGLSFHEGLGA